MKMPKLSIAAPLTAAILLLLLLVSISPAQAQPSSEQDSPVIPANFKRENLVAWCIVPFDAKNREPAERAEMVKRLGLNRVAYDWRKKHVAEFEEEIQQYKKHEIEYFAFWNWHDSMESLIKQYSITPQIWTQCKAPSEGTQDEKVAGAAATLLPLVEKTKALGLTLGIYNHGGWNGKPRNMIAVCEYLRKNHDADHVGIVYNFHHAHEDVVGFDKAFALLQPYLVCLNLNGMVDIKDFDPQTNKIKPIGSGEHEGAMIKTVIASGYEGPVGVLGHRAEMDAEESVKLNLDGLAKLLSK